jgi:tRNA pseudouridine55 synthase
MFLLVNKPIGLTSHAVINYLRRLTGIKRIGHAGTLDPFADGLLIVAVSRESTKKLNQFLKMDKSYEATLQLGAVSNTYDSTGEITKTVFDKKILPNKKQLSQIIAKFIGEQWQTPPIFSAKKIHGRKAYELARKGQTPILKPCQITIYDLKIKKYAPKKLELKIVVHCSSGTYIRSLGHDLGLALSCGAYLSSLRRTSIGPYSLKNSVPLDSLTPANWQDYNIVYPERSEGTRKH